MHDPNGPLSSKTIQYSTYGQRSERACWLVPFWSVLEDDVTVQKPEIFENNFFGTPCRFLYNWFFCGSAIDNNVTYLENLAGFLVEEQYVLSKFPGSESWSLAAIVEIGELWSAEAAALCSRSDQAVLASGFEKR